MIAPRCLCREVRILAEQTQPAGPLSEFTLDFLAGGETAEATLSFASDPTAGEISVGVASFR